MDNDLRAPAEEVPQEGEANAEQVLPEVDILTKTPEENSQDQTQSSSPAEQTIVSIATDPKPGFSGIQRTLTHASCSLSFGSHSGDERICRICWMGEEKETCVRPCRCSGSSAHVHAHCLRKWLQIANDYHCEICQFKYHTKVKMKPVAQWRWRLNKSRSLSQMEATLILLGVVTPPLICGIILCTQKVIEYIDAPDHAWKIAALMTLVMASAGSYLAALVYLFRMMYGVGQEWLRRNRQTTVRVGDIEVVVEIADDNEPSTSSTTLPTTVDAAAAVSVHDPTEPPVWSIT